MMLIYVGKLIAHLVTCICLSYVLENYFGLTDAKFWIPYIIIGMLIWIVNCSSCK